MSRNSLQKLTTSIVSVRYRMKPCRKDYSRSSDSFLTLKRTPAIYHNFDSFISDLFLANTSMLLILYHIQRTEDRVC